MSDQKPPQFNDPEGTLKYDVYKTWLETVKIWGYNHSRKKLLQKLLPHLYTLRKAGVSLFMIAGSFASNKEEPGDLDGLIDLKEVNAFVDEVVAILDESFKDKYGIEIFGCDTPTTTTRNNEPHEKFFRRGRHEEVRGFIVINLDSLP